jgi:preprotein translocase subunit SecD
MRMKFGFIALSVFSALLAPAYGLASDLLSLKIIEAERGHDSRDSSIALINVRLDEQSTQQLAQWTSLYVGRRINVIIDGQVVSQPRLLTRLTGGVLQIVGVPADKIDDLIPKLIGGQSAFAVEFND